MPVELHAQLDQRPKSIAVPVMGGVMELSSWVPPLTPDPRRGHDDVMSTALIVIDVQEEYFSGRLPIEFAPRERGAHWIQTLAPGSLSDY